MDIVGISRKKIREFQLTMIDWYAQNGRLLPWRDISDPYRIMVAELLLQKTDVGKVKTVYNEFITNFPTVQVIYDQEDSSISRIIQPLGLRYKVTRLKLLAKVIVEEYDGKIPEAEKELLKLPGVGRYIAAAVECFAYNKSKAILDTNVIRILDRVLGIRSERDRPRDDISLWNQAQTIVPRDNAKEYNWALLDFGALVCKNRLPICDNCILQNMCRFFKDKNLDA